VQASPIEHVADDRAAPRSAVHCDRRRRRRDDHYDGARDCDTSPLDPSITIAPTIGVATGLEMLGHGKVLAAGEPVRRGGSDAGVVDPSR
jgi:hypothetical protein